MSQQSLAIPSAVESVVKNKYNGPLLAAVAQLWIHDADLVVDVTYGKGNFWTKYRPANLVAHDLDPEKGDGVDFRHLPELDNTVDVVVFDPPYIAQGGRDTSTVPDMLDRYGLHDVPKTSDDVHALITAGMTEAHRVLRPKGRLLVKCMNYINGGKYIASHHHVVSVAIELGMVQVDEFIHHSGLGPQPIRENQYHARNAHSFLCVFQKKRAGRDASALPEDSSPEANTPPDNAHSDSAPTTTLAGIPTSAYWPERTL